MSFTTLAQSRPNGVASRVSGATHELLAAYPDLFHLTIEQLLQERQKASSFKWVLPPDAKDEERARFEEQKRYFEQRRIAIGIHLLRAYEDDGYGKTEREEQRSGWDTKYDDEEKLSEKKLQEQSLHKTKVKETISQEEGVPREKRKGISNKNWQSKKFLGKDIGADWGMGQEKHAGGARWSWRTVDEIDRDIQMKSFGSEAGAGSDLETIVHGQGISKGGKLLKSVTVGDVQTQLHTPEHRGLNKLDTIAKDPGESKWEAFKKPLSVDNGIQTDLTSKDLGLLLESPLVNSLETIPNRGPSVPVEIPSGKAAISCFSKSEIVAHSPEEIL